MRNHFTFAMSPILLKNTTFGRSKCHASHRFMVSPAIDLQFNMLSSYRLYIYARLDSTTRIRLKVEITFAAHAYSCSFEWRHEIVQTLHYGTGKKMASIRMCESSMDKMKLKMWTDGALK